MTSDLLEAVRTAAAEGRALEIVGSGCHPRGGPVDAIETVRAPSGVMSHEPADLTCRAKAGTTLAELDALLAEAGQELPTSGITRSATVGGVLAAGVSGRRRLRTGPLRDRVLEVRFVTGYGEEVKAGGPTVKNVSGYDLGRLLCGSLGVLGVITEVVLKVTPRPWTAGWWSSDSESAPGAVATGSALLDALHDPAAIEVSGPPWRVAVLLEGHPDDVDAQAARLPIGFAPGDEPAVPDDEVIEVAVPPAQVGAFLRGDRAARAQVGIGMVWFRDPEAVEMRARAEAVGGRLHTTRPLDGIDPFGAPPPAVGVMRGLKESFDPAGVLNPGRMPFLDGVA